METERGDVQENRYDAEGLRFEQLSNRIRYTGQQYDSLTEQYYLRARYYSMMYKSTEIEKNCIQIVKDILKIEDDFECEKYVDEIFKITYSIWRRL